MKIRDLFISFKFTEIIRRDTTSKNTTILPILHSFFPIFLCAILFSLSLKGQKNEAMTKRVFSFILLLLAASTLTAQNKPFSSSAKKNAYFSKFFWGLKGGINIPRLYYTNHYVSDLPHDFMTGLSAGVFAEFPFSDHLSLAVELNYQQRGGSTTYVYEQNYQVHYSLKANYASLRLPLYGYLGTSPVVRPYLLLGPDLGYVVNGSISLSQPGLDIAESEVSLNKSNMNFIYAGLLGGVGVRANLELPGIVLVLKADVAANYGLIDTFSQAEHNETANPTNIHAYNHQGKRISQGFEIHLSIGYIPEKKDDVCNHFNKFSAKPVRTGTRW